MANGGHKRSHAQTWRVEPFSNRGVEQYLAKHSNRPADLRIVKARRVASDARRRSDWPVTTNVVTLSVHFA